MRNQSPLWVHSSEDTQFYNLLFLFLACKRTILHTLHGQNGSSNRGSVANAVDMDAGFQCSDLQVICLPPTLVSEEFFKFIFYCFCCVCAGFERGHCAICRETTLSDTVIIVFGIMWNHHRSMSGVLIVSKSKVELN